ncbi:MAG: bifunctional folylpolyglutamate synthase/dihydrofolate synthase [Blautia sp.]|nr:bifunctional folylpolyglutamate synthase/dihydrofolate synthase [Blautia sp.]
MSSYITSAAQTYAAAERYLLEIPRFTHKNSMEDTRCFLEHLGVSEENGKTIHVAGTNGKGSVCAYLRSILQEAGFTTGMFLSPHLVTMRERFLINGEMISEEEFLWAFHFVEGRLQNLPEPLAAKSYHPTFFEYLFFMAAALFDAHQVAYRILETGLGGRLDATNSIPRKDVCVITSIGYDHMEYLGDTLPEIAAEKAGIFRKDVPAVFPGGDEEVTKALKNCAMQTGAPIFPVSFQAIKEINSRHKTIDFSLQSNYYGYIRFRMPTIAKYQMENAALAVAAIEQLSDREWIQKEHIRAGIEKSALEGRMEEIMPSVYLDGAHNIDGIRAFLETVKADNCKGIRRLLFSMVQDKQYQAVIDTIATSGLFASVGIVELQNKRALHLDILEDYFRQYTKLEIKKYDRLESAMQDMIGSCGEEERLYIVGSLYLAGEVKALLRRSSHD